MQKIILIKEPNEAFLQDLKVECYVLLSTLGEDFCLRFLAKAQTEEKIVLFSGEDAVENCKHYDADGVIVDLGAEDLENKMKSLRENLGKGKYIGLITRNRKHESMLVSEVEPDFVVFRVWKDGFDKVKELTDWYQDFFLIQSAAWVMEEGVPVEELCTDFIIESLG